MSNHLTQRILNARITESIEQMFVLIADHQRYKQNLTGNKNAREHIGMHAKYMAELYADERKLNNAIATLETLDAKYGE